MVPEVEAGIKRILPFLTAAILAAACSHDDKPTAPAIHNRDRLPIMSTTGVSKLISDSGVIRYKIIAERWNVYDRTKPKVQDFPDGIFMEKFNEKFKVEMFLTADTAYWYDQNLWELRGRVEVRKEDGTVFRTEELFWDMGKHEVYSSKYVRLVTPEQELRGVGFRSDEELTDYEVTNSAGSFPVPEEKKQEDSVKREPDVPGGSAQPAGTATSPAAATAAKPATKLPAQNGKAAAAGTPSAKLATTTKRQILPPKRK